MRNLTKKASCSSKAASPANDVLMDSLETSLAQKHPQLQAELEDTRRLAALKNSTWRMNVRVAFLTSSTPCKTADASWRTSQT